MAFSIAMAIGGWYYSDSFMKTFPVFLSAAVAVGGTFGLFALKKRPDTTHDAKLFLLVLYIDIWAVVCSLAAGILVWLNREDIYYEPLYSRGIAAPAVISHINIFIILPLIIRTLHLWWKRLLYPVPNDTTPPPVVYENHPQYVQPVYVVNDSKADPLAQPVYIVKESRADARPLSNVTESTLGTATLAYRPSMMATTQGYPSRVPSYTSRADHARLEKQ